MGTTFCASIWHIGATSSRPIHEVFSCRLDPSTNLFVNCSRRLISKSRRISDQNTVQKSNVSADDSDDWHEENEGSMNEFDAHSCKTKAE
jgi:hypothetical protein